ncbi:DivIVA domain-containing protein [Nesterenkonia ebinurensis]|uniref:DivIVA domain-containing protein n=1 Tax=Nesterenkonia ebinurensis TaxID=2608252 RepID=UPI001CC59E16|nr:DivIVA domain-containing protein [Nesterenkonia ebinurensis]
MWLFVIAVVGLGVVVVLLVGAWDGEPAPREESPAALPDPVDELLAEAGDSGLTAAHLEQVEFDAAPRGYRMEQVDKLLGALTEQLRQAQAERSAGQTGDRDRDDIAAQ